MKVLVSNNNLYSARCKIYIGCIIHILSKVRRTVRMNNDRSLEEGRGGELIVYPTGRTYNCPHCGRTIHLDNNMVGRKSVCCKRCGHSWNLRKGEPKKCPNCGSVNWNSDVGTHKCKQCKHTWTSRKENTPRKCPKCQSLSWDKEPIVIEPKKKDAVPVEIEEKIIECHEKGMGLFKAAITLDLPVFNVLAVYRKYGWF